MLNKLKLELTTNTIMLKDLISKMQDILNTTLDSAMDFSALEGDMLIVN